MKVKVLQHHIDAGTRGNAGKCPVALALGEYFPEVTLIRVGHWSLVVDNESWVYPQGSVLSDFTRSFDDGLPVEPFEFELNLRYEYCN